MPALDIPASCRLRGRSAALRKGRSPAAAFALGLAFFICYTVYGAKVGKGVEFRPFRGWGYHLLSFGQRPRSLSYGLIHARPLFFYTFFYDPNVIRVVWGCFSRFSSSR